MKRNQATYNFDRIFPHLIQALIKRAVIDKRVIEQDNHLLGRDKKHLISENIDRWRKNIDKDTYKKEFMADFSKEVDKLTFLPDEKKKKLNDQFLYKINEK